jgi:phage repressor protein C with HTH and peptisase S24 domain
MRATLMETFRVAREHTRLAWESLGTYSEPDSPILYSPVTTAVASLIREIEMLRQTTNRHERKNLLQWLSETFGEIRRELLTGERHQTSQVTGAVIPFPGARPVTLREGDVDSSRYFYIPKAEPRLAAGAGTFVTSETSDDYYAFRLDWLNHLVSKKGDLWLFDVVGDSMSNTLEHGDIVLIDCGRQEPLHGKIYAIEEDNAVSIKRVQKRKDGTFWIVSDNKATRGAYKPLYPPKRLGPHIRIIGRMIWSARTWL